MTRKSIRKTFWDFMFGGSKGKWGAIERIWNRALVLAVEGLLWVTSFYTSNVPVVIAFHILVGIAVFIYYYQAKGR